MKKERFLALLSKKFSGTLTTIENESLAHAIASSEEYSLLADQLGQYFQHHTTLVPKINELDQVWDKIATAETKGFEARFDYSAQKKTSIVYSKLFKVAAVLLVLIGAGLWTYHLVNNKANQNFTTISTTTQKTFKLLDDGTKIWLNKASTIRYNPAFGKQKREIFLEGEAYFDVVKNKEVPLFIHAGNIDIEVKGTAFNVNAYKNSSEIQVALLRGAIQVTHNLDQNYKVLLKPNEKLIFSNHASANTQFLVMPMASALLLKETKWTSDTLHFQKEKLKDLALRMEKKYDMKIEVKSEQLKEKRFSGTFINETIQQALEALKVSYPLTYTINNRLVVIND